MEIRHRYEQFEQARYGRSWTTEELALGLVGDVGDLTKLIVAHEGMREIPDVETRLAHELADCLWSILVLSQRLGVDLEDAFWQTMDELAQYTALRPPG
ncbi:MAG: nucleotide pyrophosphohydrolase [Anaerolineae bacterium]|nr:nucleotide pyrophosphohydrolase [Anaerolineae bacterium]